LADRFNTKDTKDTKFIVGTIREAERSQPQGDRRRDKGACVVVVLCVE
jgi:hypothetical protein